MKTQGIIVAPEITETNMIKRTVSEENCEMILRDIPAGHAVQPKRIANAILFLASDDARYIMGLIV